MLDDIITPTIRKWMSEEGWTVADVVRSLRPGGPQDIFQYSTHCTKCGQKVSGTFRQLGDGLCSCGGRLDDTDLRRWFEALRAHNLAAAERIASIRRVEQETGSDD